MRRKGEKKYCPPFVRLEKSLLLREDQWWILPPGARDLYLLLKCKYNGQNNGEIRLYYSEIRRMKIKGLRSDKGISAAFAILEQTGWIEGTRRGGQYRFKTDFKLTGRYDGLL